MNERAIKKEKIGRGYFKDGIGNRFNTAPFVWLINGKAYVKDSKETPSETDLAGYIMCNYVKEFKKFYAVGIISNHVEFKY